MNFEKYAGRILTIDEAREGTNRFSKKIKTDEIRNQKGEYDHVQGGKG